MKTFYFQIGCLNFLEHVYTTFGFTFQLKLSTRPEKYLGDLETWNQAEKVRLGCFFFQTSIYLYQNPINCLTSVSLMGLVVKL